MRSNSILLGLGGLALFALGAWVATLQARVHLLEAVPVRPAPASSDADSDSLRFEARIARLETRIEELRAAAHTVPPDPSGTGGAPGTATVRVTPEEVEIAVTEVLRRQAATKRAALFAGRAKNFVAGLSSGIPTDPAAKDVLITTVGRYLDDRERLMDDDSIQGTARQDALRTLEKDLDVALHKFLPAPEARHVLERLGLAIAGHGRPLTDGRERPLQPEER